MTRKKFRMTVSEESLKRYNEVDISNYPPTSNIERSYTRQPSYTKTNPDICDSTLPSKIDQSQSTTLTSSSVGELNANAHTSEKHTSLQFRRNSSSYSVKDSTTGHTSRKSSSSVADDQTRNVTPSSSNSRSFRNDSTEYTITDMRRRPNDNSYRRCNLGRTAPPPLSVANTDNGHLSTIQETSDQSSCVQPSVNGRLRNRSQSLTMNGVNKKESNGNAVVLDNAIKYYGRGKKKFAALDHLTMRVPEGAIYGLLGPSGCGKTTLLGCLVNQLRLNAGDIHIFGYKPGSAEAAIPGHRVGYMPQELALYNTFNIRETLEYFGRIHGLSKEKMKERTKFLIEFLDLPDQRRLIENLSGGQQRRVSFAAALVHEPSLLILDEPTVGVDPLLRTNIWDHLVEIATNTSTTIIITTHYIEEARRASKVGLMRKGRLLAEASPESLMNHFKQDSLETVFLKLCMKEGDIDTTDSAIATTDNGVDNVGFTPDVEPGVEMTKKRLSSTGPERGCMASEISEITEVMNLGADYVTLRDSTDTNIVMKPWTETSKGERIFSFNRLSALQIKNAINMWRNLGFLLFSFLLPPLQTVLFCLTVGGMPHDLKVSITSLDVGQKIPLFPLANISDLYLHELNNETIIQENYASFDEGLQQVKEGKTWGLIFFNETFTQDLLNINNPSDDGKIQVYMDNTNQQIAWTIKIELLAAFERMMNDIPIPDNMHIPLPFLFAPPVYGTAEPTFTEFMAPGVILTIVFFMAVGLTAMSFIIEKKEGLYNRSLVAGVQTFEIMLSHLITQMIVMLIQIATVLVFMFVVFEIPCIGNIIYVILLAILQGLCGMCFGMMISAIANSEMAAIQGALGLFYPILLLSGIVWPLEGMPNELRFISYTLPQTWACESIRCILYRGWDITYFEVWIGYFVTASWTIIYSIITIVALKIKG